MLAESLARAFDDARMADLLDELARGDDRLRFWLRERKADVVHVVERVLKVLMGKPGPVRPATAAGAEA